ncbi:hypothetical protein DDE82_005833 [Stemphylium lycopersici]|uniref:Uncharacterized protein n=1 Tax=Stemphylium lycopersici TaxID=183478 RepID=A0A364N531_STELY|nr:hypothetical protein TW65_01590 [Stemphylium lycopersici]RAR02437.1 hypothetical protein DDE82_005833 [Stemphylium lycopersici]RAR11486.1 hypothetical protein DDE83_004522 [Stemphylium lycopersici]
MPSTRVHVKHLRGGRNMGTSTHIEIAPGLFAFSSNAAERYYVGQQFVYGELAAGIVKVNMHKLRIKGLEEGLSWNLDVLAGVVKDDSTSQALLLEMQTKPPDKDERISDLEDALAKHLQALDTAIKKAAEIQQQAVQKDTNTNRMRESLAVTKTELKRIAREKDAIITGLRIHTDELRKELMKVKKDRDEYQFKFETADSSVAEIHESFKECYNEVQAKLAPTSTGSSGNSTPMASHPGSSVTVERPAGLLFTPASTSEKDDGLTKANEILSAAAEDPTAKAEETAKTLDTVTPATPEKHNDTTASKAVEAKPLSKPTQLEVKHTNTAVQSEADAPKASTPAPKSPKTPSHDLEKTQFPHPESPDQNPPGTACSTANGQIRLPSPLPSPLRRPPRHRRRPQSRPAEED